MNSSLRHRRSIRLPGFDYSSEGAYFVTICTKGREELFGSSINGIMDLNWVGEIIEEEWLKTQQIRKFVELDEYVVMPNHVHGIIWISDNLPVGATRRVAPTKTIKPCTIGSIIGQIKSTVTKRIMRTNPVFGEIWQRNYYECIIRNYDDLDAVRRYIRENPLNWENDAEFKL